MQMKISSLHDLGRGRMSFSLCDLTWKKKKKIPVRETKEDKNALNGWWQINHRKEKHICTEHWYSAFHSYKIAESQSQNWVAVLSGSVYLHRHLIHYTAVKKKRRTNDCGSTHNAFKIGLKGAGEFPFRMQTVNLFAFQLGIMVPVCSRHV